MRITVLGKSPSWQDAGGACSGYLLEEAEGGACVLLDCGSGVFGKLRAVREYDEVDAVVVTHMHADHFVDLIPFAYALTYSPRRSDSAPARPRLIVPLGAREIFRRIVGAWGQETLIEDAFAIEEYAPDDAIEIGTLRVRFQRVTHWIATCAVEISSSAGGGARFTYGADTAPDDGLVAFAQGTDLLMLEATLDQPEREEPRGHLTATEAGEHARAAQAGALVLTHISDELDGARALAQAQAVFGGPVTLATEGAVFEL